MQETTLSPLSEDGTEMKESGNGSHADSTTEMDRKLYRLFILPVIIIFAGIFCGYIRNMLFDRVRRLIRMIDSHMLSVDQDMDIDQTRVKVLDTLNSLSTMSSSIINIDFGDYFKIIQKNPIGLADTK